jgi:hypothetical protein
MAAAASVKDPELSRTGPAPPLEANHNERIAVRAWGYADVGCDVSIPMGGR